MVVKYIGKTDASLTNGKEYDVIGIEESYYRIVDNSGEDYLFPPEEFEVICRGKDLLAKRKYYREHPEEAKEGYTKRDDGVVIVTPPDVKTSEDE